MDFMRADVRCRLISALHQLVDGNTCCALPEGACSYSGCFPCLRRCLARSAWLLCLHRNTGRQGRAPGTTRQPQTLAGAAKGLSPGKDLREPHPQLGCVDAREVFSGSQFPAEHHLPNVGALWSLQRASTMAIGWNGLSSSIHLCSRGHGDGTRPQVILTTVKPVSTLTFWVLL